MNFCIAVIIFFSTFNHEESHTQKLNAFRLGWFKPFHIWKTSHVTQNYNYSNIAEADEERTTSPTYCRRDRDNLAYIDFFQYIAHIHKYCPTTSKGDFKSRSLAQKMVRIFSSDHKLPIRDRFAKLKILLNNTEKEEMSNKCCLSFFN